MSRFSHLVAVCASALLLQACSQGADELAEIREAHAAGRHQETLARLRELVDEDASNAEASFLLGSALFHTGSSGLAVWPLRKASETPEYTVEAGLLLTQAMLQSRTAPDAIEEIERVLAVEPENVSALVLRMEAYQATGKLEESIAEIDRILELDPGNLVVLVPRVTALISLERIDEAEAALADAGERFANTEGDVSSTMRARLCSARAVFALEKGEAETAETLFGECVEEFPTDELAVTEAVEYYGRSGRQDRANEILQRAFDESGNGFFRVALARRLGATGDVEGEERLLRAEAEEHPTSMTWFVLADHYVQRERFDDALPAFEQALAIAPSTPRVRFAYADTLVRAAQYDKARRVANRLEHPELKSLIRGRILLAEGDARGALTAFEAGVRLWPNNAAARFFAGQAAERVGDFARATSHYRESYRTSPASSEAGLALIELYTAQGEYDSALGIANRYARTHRRDPRAYLATIRAAHGAESHDIAAEGLRILSRLPGQAPVAAAEEAALLASSKGPEEAAAAIDGSGLDLTDPANALALRVLLEQREALSQHEEAIARVTAALEAHPDEAAFHELRGRALAASGESEPAREAFARALELDETNARALTGLATLASGRDEALALYDRAIEADAADPAPFAAAVALVREDDPAETARRLEALLDAHPRDAAAANEFAGLLADRGDLDRALVFALRAAWFNLPEAEATVVRVRELRSGAPSTSEPAAAP